jgi:phosphoribosylanthranilate isomerase
MHKTTIKICGFRDADLARQAVLAGVNYIGIVFHPASKRYVEVSEAKKIAAAVNKAGGIPVAVFKNQSALEIKQICIQTNIQMVQLHGEIPRDEHYLLPRDFQRIYVCHVTKAGDVLPPGEGFKHCDTQRDFLMFDHVEAGSGVPFNWMQFNKHQNQFDPFKWFLAGGLTAKNVKSAIQLLSPTGVDISSGVESLPGNKDIELIRQFVRAVHQAKEVTHDE